MEKDYFEPVIVGFLCRWCAAAAADAAGTSRLHYPPNIRPVRVNCSGFIDPVYILRALLEGADGVFVAGCRPGDCHYVDGNLKARRRIAILKETLKTLGLEDQRVVFEYISTSEGSRYAELVKKFTEKIRGLGPSPLKKKFLTV